MYHVFSWIKYHFHHCCCLWYNAAWFLARQCRGIALQSHTTRGLSPAPAGWVCSCPLHRPAQPPLKPNPKQEVLFQAPRRPRAPV